MICCPLSSCTSRLKVKRCTSDLTAQRRTNYSAMQFPVSGCGRKKLIRQAGTAVGTSKAWTLRYPLMSDGSSDSIPLATKVNVNDHLDGSMLTPVQQGLESWLWAIRCR